MFAYGQLKIEIIEPPKVTRSVLDAEIEEGMRVNSITDIQVVLCRRIPTWKCINSYSIIIIDMEIRWEKLNSLFIVTARFK